MVELGYLQYGGTGISRIWETRMSMIWWNYDIYDMVELVYLGYGGTMISMIRWN